MDFGSIDPLKLATNMAGAAEDRHLSIYMRDPQLGAVLAANGWDGSLPQAPPGDFLMAVDTNMGYNKANIFIERALDYTVTLTPQSQAHLTVTYRHTGSTTGEPCYQGVDQEFEEAAEYLAIADQCYWNYLRVYTPAGSTLLDSSRHTVPGETLYSGATWDSAGQTIEDIPWLTTFANFLLVPQGEEVITTFTYQLPTGVIVPLASGESLYQLDIRKQPGMKDEIARITVNLPNGATIIEASPAPIAVDGLRIGFELNLNRNELVAIRYR